MRMWLNRTADQRDVGSVTLGLAVVFPAVLIVIVSIIQAALTWHAHNLVVSAAHDAVSEARLDGADPAVAQRQARDILARTSGSLLRSVIVDVATTATQIRVHVHATVVGPLPGVAVPVDATVSGPRERFVPDDGTGP